MGEKVLTFRVLEARLLAFVNARINNGEFSERGLAKALGISQPQLHNVLKGARSLRPTLADEFLSWFGISIYDLLAPRSALPGADSSAWQPGYAKPPDPETVAQRLLDLARADRTAESSRLRHLRKDPVSVNSLRTPKREAS